MGDEVSTKPTILLPGEFQMVDLTKLKNAAYKTVDIYKKQLEELFRIEYPRSQQDSSQLNEYLKSKEQGDMAGAWVYYPWNKILLHCVSPDDLYNLRTNRNKNLITNDEQHKLSAITVGIAGMSVGAGIALSLAYSGISNVIKIADFDELDTSNLNRLRESLLSVGEKKVDLAARHIYELDPFIDIHQYAGGLNDKNIQKFFEDPALDFVVDEIDDFKMKIKLRINAKKYGIPLIMFTSLGDNILIDVERYDIDKDLVPFHGLIGDIADEISRKEEITSEDIKRYSIKIVGPDYIPTRAIASVAEMGKTLVGRPQLYSTIAVDGGLATYLIRKIALSGKPPSGRYFVRFSELLNLEDNELSLNDERTHTLNKLRS